MLGPRRAHVLYLLLCVIAALSSISFVSSSESNISYNHVLPFPFPVPSSAFHVAIQHMLASKNPKRRQHDPEMWGSKSKGEKSNWRMGQKQRTNTEICSSSAIAGNHNQIVKGALDTFSDKGPNTQKRKSPP